MTAPVVRPGKPTRKVTIGAIGSWVLGVVALLIANAIQHGQLDVLTAAMPGWANALVTPLIPALGGFVSGYLAKHGPNDTLLPVLGRIVRRSTSGN